MICLKKNLKINCASTANNTVKVSTQLQGTGRVNCSRLLQDLVLGLVCFLVCPSPAFCRRHMMHASILDFSFLRLRASDIMEPNLTYVYPHTRIQSLVSILRTTVHHAFPVVTENRGNEREFMKGNQLISNNIKFKVRSCLFDKLKGKELCFASGRPFILLSWLLSVQNPGWR